MKYIIILLKVFIIYQLHYSIIKVVCHDNTHMIIQILSSDIYTVANNISYNIPSYERQALYDLYNSTNGDNWIYREGDNGYWDFTDPNVNPCLASNPWQGLNCTLPTSLSSSSNYYISEILLSNYSLSGYLPDSIGDFNYLKYLDLSYNNINQTIPNTIGNLSFLIELDLSFNSLSGSLPNSIYELSALQLLNLGNNYYLHGNISDLIGQLSKLTYLSLEDNQLSGTIPFNLSHLTSLSYLSFSINQLTGIIPNWIGELSLLRLISLADNKFSGTIPSSLSNLISLNALSLSYNQLNGTIPNCIGELSLLTYLSLGCNLLSGTIPSTLFDLSDLKELYLYSNMFIGSTPNLFFDLPQLIYIHVDDNYLTGVLPDSISQLQNLSYLFVQNNHFSGSLDKVFNRSYQKEFRNIQLSNNQFTGKLPKQVFLSHSLIAFSAVSNCFHGSIPSIICDNTDLVSLALDGLACASSCQNKIIPGISSAYVSENEITGGIPDCLWSMEKLQILHLSGNSLRGTFPDNIRLSKTLNDLSLSYNMLTGSISSSIQERAWDNLDLSHNRISGTLRSNYASQYKNASLSLNNNRLSGSIPNSLQDMRNISILEGSYYECEYDRSDLPTHDDHRDTYECGSNVFNVLYYIWLGSVFIICSGIVLTWYLRNQIDKYMKLSGLLQMVWKWIHILEYMKVHYEIENNQQIISEKFIYFKAYNVIHEIISRYSLYNAIFIVVILLPIYIILSNYYSTHRYEYAWTVSILYLSGKIAFGIAISILLVFIFVQVYIFHYSIKQNANKQVLIDISDEQQQNKINLNHRITDDEISSQPLWKISGMYMLYLSVNITIVGGANVAYVYAVLYQSNPIIILCQILLSIFKMIWNNIISPKMVYWIINYLSMHNYVNNNVVQESLFMLQFEVSILNNIIVPCFIVAIISPNCFYHVFQQETDVTSSFSYEECSSLQGTSCIKYVSQVDSASYSPPFSYSYQCSSDFVTYYAPVFVLIGFISTFIVPLIQISLLKITLQYPESSKYIKLNKLLYLKTSKLQSPLLAKNHIYEFLVSILTLVGLMLTFGVVFPPLAIVFLLAIHRRKYYHKAIIGRYISYMMEHKVYSCLDIIEEDCKVVLLLPSLHRCGWILLLVSCMFYTLFLLDILGDEVGVAKAYWVLIVMPCIPIFIYTILKIYIYWLDSIYKTFKEEGIINKNNGIDNKIELSQLANISNPLFLSNNVVALKDNNDCDSVVIIDDIHM